MNVLIPLGLLALAAGVLLRLLTHARYTEFAAGFFIGISIVFIIAGLVRQSRGLSK
jgi:hypothetical protein